MELKENYRWLSDIESPKMVQEFQKLYGIHEIEGTQSNPIIIEWAKELGVSSVYDNDDIPWCGLAMAIIAKNAGKSIPEGFLCALNWCKFGTKINFSDASLGDILVFTREAGGHVGEYIGEDINAYHVAGGNEGNMVNIVRIAKDRLYCARRPIWKIAQPESVKKVYLLSNGLLSPN